MASLPKNLSLILIPLLLSYLIASAQAGDTVVYWGQGPADQEGTLKAACDTGNYAIVIISCLTTFGNGRTPVLNLAGHCDPSSGGCKGLASDITYGQTKGIKVLLSLGGAGDGDYSLASASDAEFLAQYLWDNFLGGTSSNRPLGSCVLDGIDFNIQKGSSDYYDYLVTLLSAYSSRGKKVYLTAAPQCAYPDLYLGKALSTGLFDFVWVQFYNNPSYEFLGDILKFTTTWNTWANSIKGTTKIYLGLAPSVDAVNSGYIAPNILISIILPVVKLSPNYGGIMLCSRYYDVLTNYCVQVKIFV